MKLDISDCPNPKTDRAGYEAWMKREREKNPMPDRDTDNDAYLQWICDWVEQDPYAKLKPRDVPVSPESGGTEYLHEQEKLIDDMAVKLLKLLNEYYPKTGKTS